LVALEDAVAIFNGIAGTMGAASDNAAQYAKKPLRVVTILAVSVIAADGAPIRPVAMRKPRTGTLKCATAT
jgi:hypothetical protein